MRQGKGHVPGDRDPPSGSSGASVATGAATRLDRLIGRVRLRAYPSPLEQSLGHVSVDVGRDSNARVPKQFAYALGGRPSKPDAEDWTIGRRRGSLSAKGQAS